MISVKEIGRHMSRTRFQRGTLKSVGKGARKHWRGEWYVYVKDADGEERRKHTSADLGPVVRTVGKDRVGVERAAAWDALQARIAAETRQAPRPSDQVTLAEFMRTCYLPLKIKWKYSTRKGNGFIIEKHIIEPLGARRLAELTKPALQAHLVGLADADYSYSLISKVRTYLHAALDEAVDQDFLRKNPARKLEIPDTAEECRRFLTPEEIARLLADTAGRNRLIFRLFLTCGFRPGELLMLKWDDVSKSTIRVDEAIWRNVVADPKTKASAAEIPAPESLLAELEAWRAECPTTPEGWLFPNRDGKHMWYTSLYQYVLEPARVAAKIPDLTFQSLRRTCATYLYSVAGPKEAQAMLRHASPDLTAAVYIQPIPEAVRSAVEAWDRKMSNVIPIKRGA